MIPEPPAPPSISKFPNLIVVTSDDAGYWQEACEAFMSAGQPDQYSLAEVQEDYPGLTQNTACNWAIYGWPVQHELTVENYMLQIAQHVKELNEQNNLLRKIIEERQAVMDSQLSKIEELSK